MDFGAFAGMLSARFLGFAAGVFFDVYLVWRVHAH